MQIDIEHLSTPNKVARKRAIRLIVLHSTRGGRSQSDDKEISATLGWLRAPESQVSSHYVVGVGNTVYELASPDLWTTWHARRHNPYSIGIEIPQPFEGGTIDAGIYDNLVELVGALCEIYQIDPQPEVDNPPISGVVEHAHLDPTNKSDIGYIRSTYGALIPSKCFDLRDFLLSVERWQTQFWTSNAGYQTRRPLRQLALAMGLNPPRGGRC